ncbi:MAG: hypothetical protein FJ405_15360, partial [Verrucomicrobia bacterium]|nr:hypothetical protein [Verrucomicrobiota bacterium]
MKSTRSPLGLFSMISVFLIGSGAVVDCPCHPRSLQARSGPDGSQTANREGFDVGITPPDAEIFRKFLHGRILFAVASLVALTAGIRLLANEDIPLWVHSAGGTSPSDELHSTAIAVGPDGSTYVAGRLRGTARLGDTHLIATNRSIVFVAKLTRSGQWAWAREECSSTDGVVECHGIAVNSSNYIFLVGRYRKDARVGDSWLRGRSEYDSAFIVRLSPDGTPSGVYGLTGESIDNPARATIRQVWVDGSDAVYVAGALTSRARFGNTLIEGGLSSGFVARLDMGSEWKWVLTISGDGISSCQGLAGDSSGLYVTGTFQGQNRFGNVTHIATNQAAFVAGLSKSGEFLWTTTLTASTNAGSMAVTPDRAGGAWIAGYFNGTVTPSTDSNLQHAGGFVARLKAGGDLAWIRQVGSAGSLPGSLSLSAEGDCYLAGQLFTPQATGPLGLTMPPDWEGYAAGYLAKLSGGGELLWAINAGTTTGEFPPLASRGALTAFAGSL